MLVVHFFFQAEDGIRDLVRSRGLGDVYKRQVENMASQIEAGMATAKAAMGLAKAFAGQDIADKLCLLYTSDAADERSSVDLGGRRIIKKKKEIKTRGYWRTHTTLERTETTR